MNSAVLKRNIKRRISAGHPWIYDNEIERCESPLDGSLVDVFTFSGQFVGRGYYNSNSIIRIRLLTRKNVPIDREFFKERFSRVFRAREGLLRNSNAVRVIFGEADGVPGLIVDRFSDYLVVQFNTLGINTFRDEIVESLVKLFNPPGIYEKSEGLALSKEGLERREEWIHGKGPELIPFVLNGIRFLADTKGQKTGFFLDQRENALRLSPMSDGGKVIDLFSYTGNFALHCLA
ncbi:MAG: class I SAM-dependent rRNA methyltransferase, partial [Mesotoga sp.]|nr:class I SAM-dependent rRNA methyltransferase [Mesotoga sp.]